MTRIFSAIVSKNFGCFILHCSPCRISCAPSSILAERERHLASAITHHLCRRRLAVSYTWGILGSTSAAPCIPQVHLQLKNDSVPKPSAARPQVIADGKVPCTFSPESLTKATVVRQTLGCHFQYWLENALVFDQPV